MSETEQTAAVRQGRVERHFDSTASYWKEVYEAAGVEASVYRERHALVLRWIDELELPPGTATLEVGCGAGLLTAALAERGHRVEALDSSPAMVALARRHLAETGMEERANVAAGDAHELPFEAGAFELVLAVGVLSWLHSADEALRELARVVRPDGFAIVTADNASRLAYLLDPRFNPVVTPVKRLLKTLLGLRRDAVPHRYFTPRSFDALLGRAGLVKLKEATVGFGPFTLLARPVLPERLGVRLHRRLQARADRGKRLLRRRGTHYVVLARADRGSSS